MLWKTQNSKEKDTRTTFNFLIYLSMEQNPSITGCAIDAALETTLAIELFLNENYCFRRNVLNGKVEFVVKPIGEAE